MPYTDEILRKLVQAHLDKLHKHIEAGLGGDGSVPYEHLHHIKVEVDALENGLRGAGFLASK